MCEVTAFGTRQWGKINEGKWPKAIYSYKSALKGASGRPWRRSKEWFHIDVGNKYTNKRRQLDNISSRSCFEQRFVLAS